MITTTAPANFTMGVSPTTSVVFTFSVAMNTSVTAVQFLDASNPGTPLSVSISWNAAKTQLTCAPQPAWPQDTAVTWVVTGQDQANHPLIGTTSGLFMTGSGGPSVASVTPENGATDVPANSMVVFTFSAPMNMAQTSAFFRPATDPLTTLPVTVSWSADKTEMTCTPNLLFPVGQLIQWSVFGEDLQGQSLQSASGFFSTVAGTVSVVSVSPDNGAEDVPGQTSVSFTFSTAMDTNLTSAQFHAAMDPAHALPITIGWGQNQTQMTCTPQSPFPAGQVILWNVSGEDASGHSLQAANGMFTVITNSTPPVPVAFGLLSRGTVANQVEAELLETSGQEFIALSGQAMQNQVAAIPPGLLTTNVLQNVGSSDAWEFSDEFADAAAFASHFPAGAYRLRRATDAGSADAVVNLADGAWPTAPLVANWQTTPHAVLRQPWTLLWSYAATGATVDYVRVRIEMDGSVIFTSPLPNAAQALTGTSNSVVIPGEIFTNAGVAEISLTAFHFTSLDDHSLPGTAVRGATHSTTHFELRVVDSATPMPSLLTTNLPGVPVGEPFLSPLRAKHGVRPLHYELVSGSLPPGLSLDGTGWLTGQATTLGTYDVRLRITDLLGRVATQSLHVATVPLPPDTAPPHLENLSREGASTIVFDLVGAAGSERFVERSLDLVSWNTVVTTNPATDRVTLKLPADGQAAFFRARGAGLPFLTSKPRSVVPRLNPLVTTAATLDELGGTVTLTNSGGYVFRLNVPPGALDRTETISMTELSQVEGLPMSGGFRAAVDLRPEGLMFNEPARLDIASPQPVNPATTMGFGAQSDGSHFALNPAFVTNNTVSLYLWHFSPAGMGEGTSSDAAAQAQNGTGDPMTSLAQQVAAAIQACKANPNCQSIGDELIPTYIQMADQVVIPKLKEAASNEAVLDDALRCWLRWLKDLSMLGYYDGDLFGGNAADGVNLELHRRICRAGGLAAKAIRNGIDRACQQCLAHEIQRIFRMLELARTAAILGLDYGDQQFWSCVRKCLVFELEVESEIIGSDGGVTYSAHTKGKAKLRPQTLGDGDPNTADWVRLMMIFQGKGSWDITVQNSQTGDCVVLAAPIAGKLQFPWVKIHLYKQRQVWVPGTGPVTSYVFEPDMTVKMRSGLPPMPKEKRTMYCPKAPPAAVPNLFEQTFNAFHSSEAQIPSGLEQEVLGGPVFTITGFTPGGPDDVILSKPYFRTLGVATENTLIQLRHTPAK